jgi:DNA-binding winged helix-turn-helix (wHTH) protein
MIRFGPFQIDESKRLLLRGNQPVKIERIPIDILLFLIRLRGRVVTRDEIAEQVWGGRYVETTDAINTAIRKIRRAIDDDADEPRYVRTVIGRGYQFIAEADTGEDLNEPTIERDRPENLSSYASA